MCRCQTWENSETEALRRFVEDKWGDVGKARLFLERAGWSRAEIPLADNGRDFWTIVVGQLSIGAAPGFCALVGGLLDELPLNPEVQALARKVGHRSPRSTLDGLTEGVADLLAGVSSVGAIADSLRVRETRSGEALRMAVARRLFADEVGLRSVAAAFSGSAAPAEIRAEIADRVVPFKETVPRGAARQLAPLLTSDEGPDTARAAVVGVRARATPLAYWYVINASCRSDRTDLPATVEPVRGGEPGSAGRDLAAAIRRELLEIVGYLPGDPEPDAAELDVALGWIEEVHRRRVAVLLEPPWHPDLVDSLRREFPRLVFVVLTAGEPDPRVVGPADLLMLESILDPRDEDRFYWYYRAMTGRPPRSSAPRSA
ncbi:hypothetical protein [Frankia sp. QA3]|uniref:hypothetical protein n=1 Tax=Frankia sp. QA3 TaxID=710111 RepID=UPI000269BF1F|nr:hypothetical protein [Frankia sp. QA3]EIV91488.1 hypothetical protein FraQA3DRAFT_0943 [Frankia sp. QA3]